MKLQNKEENLKTNHETLSFSIDYLISTNKGNIYSIVNDKVSLLFANNKKSIYTNDISFRFIRRINDFYWYGRSEDIISFSSDSNHVGFSLPGLVDIKDMVVGGNFVAILSGCRDSVYILNKQLNQIVVCFNINKDGKLEFFKDRQVQCQEISSNYFQIFYCPAMNNFWDFNRLELKDNNLHIISDNYGRDFNINLKDFSYNWQQYDFSSYHNLRVKHYDNISKYLKNEIITDYIEC